MNKLNSMKCAAVLVPALAIGMPIANAQQQLADSEKQHSTTSVTGAGHGQFHATMPVRGYQSDNLIGHDVKSRTNNDSVGSISNLLMDEDGQIVAVVIGVGGLLGMGERDVAIGWDQIERSYDGDDTTLWVNLTEQQLKDAPEYTGDKKYSDRDYQRTGQRADQQTDRSADRTTDRSADESAAQRAAATVPGRATADAARTRGQETARHHYLENMPARGYHSDSLVGHDVKNRRNDETIGTISNLVIDHDGQVVAAIISVGGLLGIGARDVAISWDQIERNVVGDDLTLTVDMDEKSLKDAPKYSSDRKATRRIR
jgi:sporulation protein YlmC with PRC-barrel domain